MKAKLVIEAVNGEPFEQDIEVAAGDHLIFKIHAPARPAELAEIANRIQRFFDGVSGYILLPSEVSVIQVRSADEEPASGT